MKFEDLNTEMQEKVEACETAEELMKLVEDEGIELSEEDLDDIAGGRLVVYKRRLVHIRDRKPNKPQTPSQPQPQPQPQNNPDPASPDEGPIVYDL